MPMGYFCGKGYFEWGVKFEMGYNVGKFAVFWPSDYIQISLRTNRDSHDKHFDPLHDL